MPDGSPTIGRVASSATYGRCGRRRSLIPRVCRILADRGLTVGPVLDQLRASTTSSVPPDSPTTDAVRTFYSLLTYVFGFVIWELPRVHQQPAETYTAAWNDATQP